MSSTPLSGLKRGCTSLSSENLCSACGSSFSAAHVLDKHQKYSCRETSKELKQLAAYSRSYFSQDSYVGHSIKRRRLQEEQTGGSDVRRSNSNACFDNVAESPTTRGPVLGGNSEGQVSTGSIHCRCLIIDNFLSGSSGGSSSERSSSGQHRLRAKH